MRSHAIKATRGVYAGLFLTTMATLMYQLLLTRIFSVTMWYHFSFMAISVSMFGMTVGAIIVYLLPQWFAPSRAQERMGQAALAFGVLIVFSFLTHLSIPFIYRDTGKELVYLWAIAVNYAILSLPFIASGVCVTIALTKYSHQIGRLYAVDLIGAGLGCLSVALLLVWLDAPTLVINIAVIAAVAGIFCLWGTPARGMRRAGIGIIAALIVFSVACDISARRQQPLIRPVWVKGEREPKPLFENWNSYSRIAVWEGRFRLGWGLSERFKVTTPVEQMDLNIDARAATVLTRFDGDLSKLSHLAHDITNICHYVRSDGKALIIGVGGGRDILSALYFQQREIVGVEINGAILDALTERYGDYTGHLDRKEGVRFVNDEARSYIARTKEQFDIIQLSMIDTWAATNAGAFVLSENSLYTVEAWNHMIDRLTPTGVLSFSRYHSESRPGELYRLMALAITALRQRGIENPRRHVLIVHRPQQGNEGIATLLVSPSPFSSDDIAKLEQVSEDLAFKVLLTPGGHADETLAQLATTDDLAAYTNGYPIDISPPTDNRPFFFNMLRLRDMFDSDRSTLNAVRPNMVAVTTLGVLLITVIVLTGACVVVPLWLTTSGDTLSGSLPLFMYFCSIGLGFMLVEISLMQRLNVFLGHPIYSITVVLFCLLLSSGVGSWLSSVIVKDVLTGSRAPLCLAMLVLVILLVGLAGPRVFVQFESSSTPGRIAMACMLLVPLGLCMGMGFPLGMRAASLRAEALTPWLFGMNGATSICGSVLAIVIALSFSISTAYFVGGACYVAAVLAFLWARRRQISEPAAVPAELTQVG